MVKTAKPVNRLNGIPDVKESVETTEPMNQDSVVIEPINMKVIRVRIEGVTPLVVQAWSKKVLRKIEDDQGQKATTVSKRQPKVPQDECEAAKYISKEGWEGVPAGGMKACLVNACRTVDGLPMTLAKRMIFIHADGYTADGIPLVKVKGESHLWTNPVRIAGGKMDLRHRPRYDKWSIELTIEFLANIVSSQQIVNLLNLAGTVEGLCEWRPGSPKNNSGDFGRFRVAEKG